MKDTKKKINYLKKLWYNSTLRLILIFLSIYLICASTVLFVEYRQNPQFRSLFDGIYWAIVTGTTTGYGDKIPISHSGKIIAIFTMLVGVAVVGTVTGRISSFLVEKTIKEGRGLIDLSRQKDHLIICGWKKNINSVLDQILIYNPDLELNNIVIVANIEPDAIELFRQEYPKYKDVNILRGEPYNENILQKANVKYAREVLIFSDETGSTSPTEIDSRTIMVAMAIRNISKDVHICVELLDRKFETYLKNVNVDEIIYTNEYSNTLLASATSSVGIVKIINDFLSVETEAIIVIKSIPLEFIGKQFSELKEYYYNLNNIILIGLLENIGSHWERKREAIKEAQKTTDISKLVSNLKYVKIIENNLPNIAPPSNYKIPPNSMAIIIGRKIKDGNNR